MGDISPGSGFAGRFDMAVYQLPHSSRLQANTLAAELRRTRKRLLYVVYQQLPPLSPPPPASAPMSAGLVPLASLSQIEKTPSREDGLPEDLEEDLKAYGCKLIHEAGILLKQCVLAKS